MEEPEQSSSLDLRGLPARFRSLRRVFEDAARQTLLDHDVKSYAISISFVNDSEISRINRQSLHRSGATDVIAFDLSEKGLPVERVGDVYISVDTAVRNSERFGVTPAEEMLRLIIHGVLHVLGYRDTTSPETRKIRKVQESVVKRFSSDLKI
jgi:probable rRNA maturation factor